MDIERTKERWQEIQSILDEVFDRPESQWTQFVQQRCGGDQSLFEEVQKLLAAEKSTPDFLEQPAIDFTGQFFNEDNNTSQKLPHPIRIGPFELTEELGRGGMGVVYKGHRVDGNFDQEVAIKLLINWHHNQQHLARFQQEQQLLATLNHPNIASLFDGGITDDGQPYLVMEYVQGLSITQYCKQHQLSIKARLQLVAQVAQALSYAHKSLVVHRDIKPSNILINNEGDVKLLDFGIAKMIDDTREFQFTQTGEHLLTPGHSAPEQLQGKAITVATDIYQLGLILYQLLCGKQAFSDQAQTFYDLAKVMCEGAPTLPSAMLSNTVVYQESDANALIEMDLPDLRTTGERKQRQKQLIGELDAITLQCLRCDPLQRYPSMDHLLDDINAYFDRRPVSAQQNNVQYQVIKFSQRHWRALTAGLAFISILIVYAFTVTIQAERIQQALERSELEKEKASQVAEFLVNVFSAADPNVSGLEVVTAQQLLEQGQQRIFQDLDKAPEIQGQILTSLGKIYYSQGLYDNSRKMLEQALQQQRNASESDPLGLANAITQLAISYQALSENEKAEALFEESIAIHEHQGVDSVAYAETLSARGVLFRQQGNFTDAENLYRQAISMLESISHEYDPELGAVLNNLANLQTVLGQFQQAQKNMATSLKIQEHVLGEKHSYFMLGLVNYAIMLTDMEIYDEAQQNLERALKLQREVLGEAHIYVSHTLRSLGILNYRLGKFELGNQQLQQALEINQKKSEKPDFITAVIYLWLGATQQDLKNYVKAGESYEKMQVIFDGLEIGSPIQGRALTQTASLAFAEDKLLEAGALYLSAMNLLPNEGMRTSLAQLGYAQVLLKQNQAGLARDFAQRALASRIRELPEKHSLVAEAQAVLGLAFYDGQDLVEAEALMVNAYKVLKQNPMYQRYPRLELLHSIEEKLQ